MKASDLRVGSRVGPFVVTGTSKLLTGRTVDVSAVSDNGRTGSWTLLLDEDPAPAMVIEEDDFDGLGCA